MPGTSRGQGQSFPLFPKYWQREGPCVSVPTPQARGHNFPIPHAGVREFPNSKNPRTSASQETLKVTPLTTSQLRNPSKLLSSHCLLCPWDGTLTTVQGSPPSRVTGLL